MLSKLNCLLLITFLLGALSSSQAQDESKLLFNFGGGIGFPQGDLGKFINNGGHAVIGVGYGFSSIFGLDTEFMWHDLPVNSNTLDVLQTPGASARQYSWTFNPIVRFPEGHRFGAYAIGGIGWYHRSGETTTPGLGVICDPYWSWWYGCAIGTVNFVTGSTSADAFGENIGGGLTVHLGTSRAKFYTEVRYHHAEYKRVSTNLLPLTFGIRW
jgi:Outer membrane protein beta-barrel domain